MKVTIYGERCSGTNYLEELLVLNFNVEIVWDYGWKHFFGFHDLRHTDDVLFIGIIRNLEDWINSMYREQHHFPKKLTIHEFLNDPFYSISDGKEIMEDRHIETKQRYKNIFELRHVKNKFLIETMPTLVKHYCLITYEHLLTHFDSIMNHLKHTYHLTSKFDVPRNIMYYKKEKNKPYQKKINEISKEIIYQKANLMNQYLKKGVYLKYSPVSTAFSRPLTALSVTTQRLSRRPPNGSLGTNA